MQTGLIQIQNWNGISQSDTEAVFNAVSHFKDPDTEESKDDETNIFVIVKSDGVWKTKTFTLPY